MANFLNRKLGIIASYWGVLGTLSVLLTAVFRMSQHAIEGLSQPLNLSHYLVMVPWIFFMVYSEGYKGFQKSFSPRVAARAIYLKDHATVLRAVFAPIFCMGFFDSTRKRKIVIWTLLIGVTAIVILFRFIPQPWRGVLDIGVIFGLSWGMLSTLYFFVKYLSDESSVTDPEIPKA